MRPCGRNAYLTYLLIFFHVCSQVVYSLVTLFAAFYAVALALDYGYFKNEAVLLHSFFATRFPNFFDCYLKVAEYSDSASVNYCSDGLLDGVQSCANCD